MEISGEYSPPENDDAGNQTHLKGLQKEELSRNKGQSVILTLMEETQRYREAEIRSLDAATRVKEAMAKYKSLQTPTEVTAIVHINGSSIQFTTCI